MKHTPLLLGLLLAQASPPFAAEVKATDAAAPVPPAGYRSAFEGYRPATDEPLADWRQLNEEVAAVGGHAGIMRGTAPQPAKAGTPPSAPSAPATAGHHH
jgi:hypothetical protein